MATLSSEELRSPSDRRSLRRVDGSWPLYDQARHFELGHILNSAVTDAILPLELGALGLHHAGMWECNLADGRLTWSGGVYDLFGLERGSVVTREQALSHYAEDSRCRLERLRAHALRHRCGFTLDVAIQAAAVGEVRHVRLIGAPVYSGDVAVALHGLKLVI